MNSSSSDSTHRAEPLDLQLGDSSANSQPSSSQLTLAVEDGMALADGKNSPPQAEMVDEDRTLRKKITGMSPESRMITGSSGAGSPAAPWLASCETLRQSDRR